MDVIGQLRTPGRFSSRGKSPRTLCIGGWVGPVSGMEEAAERNNSCPQPRIEPRSSSAYRSHYTDWATSAWLLCAMNTWLRENTTVWVFIYVWVNMFECWGLTQGPPIFCIWGKKWPTKGWCVFRFLFPKWYPEVATRSWSMSEYYTPEVVSFRISWKFLACLVLPQYDLHIGYDDKYTERSINAKFLGLQIDNHLDWNNHIHFPHCAFKLWCSVKKKHRDNFTITFK
jgi:hypothetical protein